MVLGARFIADHRGDALHQGIVPGGGESDGLGEDRGRAGPGHAVQAFIPPVVFRDAEPRDGGGAVLHLRDLFLKGHLTDQLFGPDRDGQIGILPGHLRDGSSRKQQNAGHHNEFHEKFSGLRSSGDLIDHGLKAKPLQHDQF